MRIALYARVSTNHQQQTHTIDQQLSRLRAYVITQPDWSSAKSTSSVTMVTPVPSSNDLDLIISVIKPHLLHLTWC